MTISGLVLTMDGDPLHERAARLALAADDRFEIGPSTRRKLPVVVETNAPEEERMIWETLHALSGVSDVALVFAHFSDVQNSTAETVQRTPTICRNEFTK